MGWLKSIARTLEPAHQGGGPTMLAGGKPAAAPQILKRQLMEDQL